MTSAILLLCVVGAVGACAPSCSRCVNDTVCLSCEARYFGKHCLMACSPLCGAADGACDKESGACEPCNVGAYGPMCAQLCPQQCAIDDDAARRPCTSDENGLPVCDLGCVDGFFAADCSKTCSSHCAVSREDRSGGGGACARDGGACQFGCQSGFGGPRCETSCASCGAPASEAVAAAGDWCDASGACAFGCPTGQFGARCMQTCRSECADNECEQETGDCLRCGEGRCGSACASVDGCANAVDACTLDCGECVNGRYGALCEKPCTSAKCVRCDKRSGECVECAGGRFGAQCAGGPVQFCAVADSSGECQVCERARWGERCEEACGPECDDAVGAANVCARETGECVSCVSCKTKAIVVGVMVPLFVIACLVAVLVTWRLTRQQLAATDAREKETQAEVVNKMVDCESW
jgi:hypothetical protein